MSPYANGPSVQDEEASDDWTVRGEEPNTISAKLEITRLRPRVRMSWAKCPSLSLPTTRDPLTCEIT